MLPFRIELTGVRITWHSVASFWKQNEKDSTPQPIEKVHSCPKTMIFRPEPPSYKRQTGGATILQTP